MLVESLDTRLYLFTQSVGAARANRTGEAIAINPYFICWERVGA
ncbi:MAG: hypothetical protein Q4C98_05990 [Capnocytophaga sp.]|nr:hypothetical protein [Capnocytophaga sp.]